MPESSAIYGPSFFGGYSSVSGLSTAPMALGSVHFRGWAAGGSQDMLNGARLVYRYKLEFDTAVALQSIFVRGAAFNGGTSTLRLLGHDRHPLRTIRTIQGNAYGMQVLDCRGITGSTFYVDEYDDSTVWRYRDAILVGYMNVGATQTVSGDGAGSPCFGSGTNYNGFVSQSNSITAPSAFQSAHYRGTTQGGVNLAYRLTFTHSQEMVFHYGVSKGAAYAGTFSATTAGGATIASLPTGTAPFNNYYGFLLDTRHTPGSAIKLQEIDTNTVWRYRDLLTVVGEPKSGVPVTGTVVLDSLTGATPIGEPIEVEVYQNAVLIASRTVYLNAQGRYWLQVEGSGEADFRFKGRHWLAARTTANLGPAGATTVNAVLPNGDCDNDNDVDLGDFLILAAAYEAELGEPTFSASADLDEDDAVDVEDFLILAANYETVGS